MNITLSHDQAEELQHLLAGLLHWLTTTGDVDNLWELGCELRFDARRHGGPLADVAPEDIVGVFTDLIDVYTSVLLVEARL
jgi:hypothetical protein